MLDKQQLKEITDISVPKIIERMQHEEICGIVATTKESMIPASLVSALLCLPLYSIDNGKLIKVQYTLENGGTRAGRYIEREGKFLVIDIENNQQSIEKMSAITKDFHYVDCNLGGEIKCQDKSRENEEATIVIINHESTLTGAPIFMQDMANWIQENCEVKVIFLDSFPNDLYKLNEEIEVIYYNGNHTDLLYHLRKIQPFLIYANSLSPMARIHYFYEEYLPRTIFHFHECVQDLTEFTLGEDELYKVFKKAKAIFYVAEAIKENMINLIQNNLWYDANDHLEDKFHFCPEFIHPRRIKEIKENDIDRPDNERPLIGMCGVNSMRKNFDLFLDIAEANPHMDFIWIGANEPIKSDLDNFTCIESCKNPYAYFNKLDYFLLTSLRDPCPIVVLENMLLNKKIILLDKNIRYEHNVSELENVYVIPDHDDDGFVITDYLKTIDMNTKQNTTNKNSEYIENNFSSPKVKDTLLCYIRQEEE